MGFKVDVPDRINADPYEQLGVDGVITVVSWGWFRLQRKFSGKNVFICVLLSLYFSRFVYKVVSCLVCKKTSAEKSNKKVYKRHVIASAWIDRKQKTDRWSGGGLDRTAAVSDLRPLTTSLLGRLNDQQTIYAGFASVLKTSTSCQNSWVFQDQHNWISRTDHKTIVLA